MEDLSADTPGVSPLRIGRIEGGLGAKRAQKKSLGATPGSN